MSSRIKRVLGYDDGWWKWLGILFFTFFVPIVIYGDHIALFDPSSYASIDFIISFFYTFTLWLSNRAILIRVLARHEIPAQWTRALFHFLALVFTLLLVVNLMGTVLTWILFYPKALNNEFIHNALASWGVSAIITFAVNGTYFAGYMLIRLKKSLVEEERLRRENTESQFESLKSQVNPHFLFNSLNTLAGIIPEDQEKAIRYTENLSKVYRYILEIKDQKIISVQDEMKCVEAYIRMFKIRFGNDLKVQVNIQKNHQEQHIVPLSLQMLLENAIKHNIISNRKPLIIEIISGTNDKLIVRNKLQKKKNAMISTGMGLKNIRSRYRIIAKKDVVTTISENAFTVSLPLIQVETYEGTDS